MMPWLLILVPPAVFVGMVVARPVAEAIYRIRHGKKMPY